MLKPHAPGVYMSALAEATRLHTIGELKRARVIYEDLARRHPNEALPRMRLAELDIRDGRLVSARRALEDLARANPHAHDVRTALAGVAEELGDTATAIRIYRDDIARLPSDGLSHLRLATALQSAGNLAESAAAFRTIVAKWPSASAGYVGLAAVDTAAVTDQECDRLRHLAATAPAQERTQACFALGDVLDRRGLFDDAFSAYQKGAAFHVAGLGTPARDVNTQYLAAAQAPAFASLAAAEAAQQESMRSARGTHTPEFFARHRAGGIESPAPIFIVGMPRSGSTLLEQILSSHPKVHGLGETLAFPNALAREASAPRQPSRPFFSRVGDAYLAALKELGWSGEGYVVDKLPGNFVNVGAIHLALPRATIVHSLRDPIDTCFSCFRHLFRDRNETTYDLAAMGRYYVAYRELMNYWDSVLPGRVVHVRYEDLLDDPEAQIRRLVAACGLEWNDACLRFHESG
ncbi:MAG: sulfotransferase, partial [Alphaproteobacteria bacterium]|nr:sulfotransferase [Alphaproteobacteria bacterium]